MTTQPKSRTGKARTAARFEEIAEAAIDCFTEAGYRRTQVADIARQMGVSAGTLYLYAASKEALLHLAVMRLCGLPLEDLPVPLPDPGIGETAALLRAKIGAHARWPLLGEALTRASPADASTLAAIGGALHDVLAEQRRIVWLLDSCAFDIAELNEIHRQQVRGAYLDDLVALIGRGAAPDWTETKLRVAARCAIEIVAWAAMHRRRERPFAHEATCPEEAEARDVASRLFASALMAVRN
ncbi:MAG TPA: helix-turn-helix domain-containing protein [Parvibaculum sp.]|uniref:TetR/AcrR family transcriptional regulator n=1 Tax=Parvibaculum sp. TaxID=2024848 RepID=UPI002BA7C505|nr:helix-turn-helix domain-containing protein [Parvibaculum sp.]HMM15665.1 helix-turn-helix domain-containing protein [Parvibaculum sp.]